MLWYKILDSGIVNKIEPFDLSKSNNIDFAKKAFQTGDFTTWSNEYKSYLANEYKAARQVNLSEIDKLDFLSQGNRDLLKIAARNGDASKVIQYSFREVLIMSIKISINGPILIIPLMVV